MNRSAASEILEAARTQELTVEDAMRITGHSQSAARQKLQALARMGELVRTRRKIGRHNVTFYSAPGLIPEAEVITLVYPGGPPVHAASVWVWGLRP